MFCACTITLCTQLQADSRKQKFTEHQLELPEDKVYKDNWVSICTFCDYTKQGAPMGVIVVSIGTTDYTKQGVPMGVIMVSIDTTYYMKYGVPLGLLWLDYMYHLWLYQIWDTIRVIVVNVDPYRI